MASNFKAPPSLEKSSWYDAWFKKLNIWQAFTGIDEKKGSRVFLTHAGKARETLLALDVKKINCEPVVYTNCLKNLYLKDRKKQPLRRMINLNNSVKDCWIRLIEYVFIFSCISCLLKAANLSEYHENLTRAAISELNCDVMKTQLKNIWR